MVYSSTRVVSAPAEGAGTRPRSRPRTAREWTTPTLWATAARASRSASRFLEGAGRHPGVHLDLGGDRVDGLALPLTVLLEGELDPLHGPVVAVLLARRGAALLVLHAE